MKRHIASVGTDVAYEKGRGGVGWPTTRYTAEVNGKTLMQKGGERPRKFKTRAAAMRVARAECGRLDELQQ
ncbi:MAG: hypothetical protein AAFQ38_16385 [Pseudomonadota bacterium]